MTAFTSVLCRHSMAGPALCGSRYRQAKASGFLSRLGSSSPCLVAQAHLARRSARSAHTAVSCRLSDGQRLRQWQPGSLTSGAGGLTQNVVASHDARWLAENTQIDSQIRDVSTGTILATVPRGQVVAFSWDGSRILVVGSGGISLRDWREGRDLWKACSFEPVGVRPAAADFMVGLHGRGPRELRIVARDGRVTPIAGDILPATAYEVTPLFDC